MLPYIDYIIKLVHKKVNVPLLGTGAKYMNDSPVYRVEGTEANMPGIRLSRP
jgi:hypothetical protein